jgi:hypothetical protein
MGLLSEEVEAGLGIWSFLARKREYEADAMGRVASASTACLAARSDQTAGSLAR